MALSSPSPEIKQLPTSPGLPVSGPLYRLAGRYRGQLEHRGERLLREARRAGLQFSTGRSSSVGHRRAPTATSRLGLALRRSGASRRGNMCWIASVCFCTAENCWAQSSNNVAEQSSLGDKSVEKAHFVDIAPLSKAEP